jgi:DinB superfamily
MAPQEKSELVRMLEECRQEVLAAAEIPESHASKCPEEGRWSVLECLEHVTVVEGLFLGRLQTSGLEAPPPDKPKEAEIATRVANRTTKIVAPEVVRPAGRYATLGEAIEAFNAARARTIRFAEERGADLYSLAADHPRFGRMNGGEVMVLIAGHARRHAAQMREVRTALGV